MLCWFSHSIVFHRHISISIKADGTHLCCAGRELTVGNSPDFWITHGSYEKNLIRGGGDVFHRHIFSFKADGTHLCCASSPIVLCFANTNHSQSRLIAPYSSIQYCVSHTHIILIQAWWHTFMLCWFSYSIVFHRHKSFSVKADRTLQYCVWQTHINLIQGWWRTVMLCWFSYSIVFHRHLSISVKAVGAHLCFAGSPIVLCFTDTYQSHSRLMAHIYVVLVLP